MSFCFLFHFIIKLELINAHGDDMFCNNKIMYLWSEHWNHRIVLGQERFSLKKMHWMFKIYVF